VVRNCRISCNHDGFGFKTIKIEIVIILKAAAKYQQLPLNMLKDSIQLKNSSGEFYAMNVPIW